MELNWMGRYRELVRDLVYYSNSSNRNLFTANRNRGDEELSMHEYQILEYICEFENDKRIMADISRDTGIAQSIITKATKKLIALGLVERYRLGSNRKSIILRPTQAGKDRYTAIASEAVAPAFLVPRSLSSTTLQQMYPWRLRRRYVPSVMKHSRHLGHQ